MADFVSRVIKLDAVTLDNEFYNLIRNQLFQILHQLKLARWIQKFGPEVELLIKFLIWKFSVFDGQCTLGQKLLGVRYPNHKGRLKLLFFVEDLVPYLNQRILSLISSWPIYNKIERTMMYIENGVKVSHLINFCAFLIENRYPTLSLRLARLPMVPTNQRVHPSVGYSYQIRELLWHHFADFLMIILPLINIHRLKRYMSEWSSGGSGNSSSSNRSNNKNDKTVSVSRNSQSSNKTDEDNDRVLKCCLCEEDATLPQRLGKCVYCYYCLKANQMADPQFQCRTCQHAD